MGNLTHTVSGDIASFRSAARVPIESLKCHFLPIQEGTGNPSPDNVRPISGWNQITAYKSKKNLAHIIGWGAQTVNSITATRILSNSYGTTINTLDFIGETGELNIIQSQATYPEQVNHYRNGYFAAVLDNLKFEKTYTVSFKISNIINNPLEASLSDLSIGNPYGNRYYTSQIINNRVIFHNYIFKQSPDKPERTCIDIRNCGMSFTISEFMVTEEGISNEEWEPYCGNIIPITFPTTGKNILNPANIQIYNSQFTLNNGTYTSTMTDERATLQLAVQLWKTNNSYLKSLCNIGNISSTGRVSLTFTVDDAQGQYICLKHNGTKKDLCLLFPVPLGLRQYTLSVNVLAYNPTIIGGIQLSDIQLEVGDTATAYEVYRNDLDNTIYGGYVDLINGEVVKTWEAVNLGNLEWTVVSNPNNNSISWFRALKQMPDTWHPGVSSSQDNSYAGHIMSDRFKVCAAATIYSGTAENNSIAVEWTTPRSIRLKCEQYNLDTEVLTTALQNVLLYYELVTPIHYPISKIELKTFLDRNNIYSNTNDITEVSYQIHDSNMIKEVKKNIIAENNQHYKRVIWNQIDDGVNADGWTPYNTQRLSVNFSDGIADCEVLDKNNGGYSVSLRNKVYPNVNMASKYYASYLLNPEYYGRFGLEYAGGYQETELMNRLPNQWGRCSFMQQGRRDASGAMYMPFPFKGTYPANTNPKFKIKAPIYINLTQMFGTGNEPETIREFEALCKYNNINLNEYHPQNTTGTPMTWIVPNRKKLNWNQYAPELSLDNYKAYNTDNTLTFENGELVITYGATYTDYRNCITTKSSKQYYQNHKYYVKQDFCPSWNSTLIGVSICNYGGLNYPQATANQYTSVSYIREKLTNSDYHNIFLVYPQGETGIMVGATCKVKNIILVDLTVMFGAGNEPATATEFEALCEKNYVDLNRYWPIHAGDQQLWII